MSGSGGGNTAIGQPGFNPNGPGTPSFRPPTPGGAMQGGGNFANSGGYQTGGASPYDPMPSAPNPNAAQNYQNYVAQNGANPKYLADPNMGGAGDSTGGGYSGANMGGAIGGMDGQSGGAAPYSGGGGATGPMDGGGLLGSGFQNNGWGQNVNTMSSTSNPVSPQQMQYIRATQAAHPGMANQLAMRQAGPAPRMNEDGTMQAQRDHGMMPMSDAQRAQIAQQQIAPGGPMSVAQQYQSLGPGANQFIANQIPQLQNGISRTSGTFDPNNAFNGGGIRPEDQQALQQQLARYQAMQTYGQGR